ncbi:DJ-1/PfpI family protein [Enterococcus raffinosus]|uniref:DJ-1/PfpI family protein n=1 Tax=Enterococcus raffinosus TaxID=71452 RepID=A0AAW8T5P0_9ENTE|nr:DJ-1/PfpI family protein [Enterococcus raffinosus]MDT2522471.1 DJ-1/PfpI family protein [Enterococcus raffinosus]MDT2530439.1 DJ-1/PfpI family protein [Enterococcus raffinosus]MDT2533612.1 DJ-1/PfpI family protein [Enterococcus raffinosus]MDT2543101.1 DJ-1/PfpI family protein [Enterococcus raffinosus]MDT2553157.1 DJ-1/PfpI family protein [Enterococcus raffinosus]
MKKVLLLLANGFESYEASVFTDVFGWNLYEGDQTTELVSVGLQPVLDCTWGYSCIPMFQLKEIDLDEFDALAIPGGFEEANFYQDAFSEDFLAVIRAFDQQNKPIAAICVGGLAVAKSGVLNGRMGTTYRFENNPRQNQMREMGVQVKSDERIVEDRNIITSSSPETALDVAFRLLEKLTSEENTQEVKRRMGFTR